MITIYVDSYGRSGPSQPDRVMIYGYAGSTITTILQPRSPTSSSPSVNVVVTKDAGDILMIRRSDNDRAEQPG
ncbi:hypothetical protein SAMN05421874_101258 [Nonomuraea maritima]|uniref:Uncharacterized protein n=1 Tax=Nonomuraea maritima TaxID=683260 RepID=A0A1G8SCB6_9ACTN|nr:hypothetical protein SAMN05421874_101258 [Nonomuraea maritima]